MHSSSVRCRVMGTIGRKEERVFEVTEMGILRRIKDVRDKEKISERS